ncbi:MAG: hypothetical protein ACRDK9_04180 [Solirubrobacterales bacterium]
MDSELLKQITIPVFTGVIGYIINWSGVWMLFHPIRFVGFRIPGLAAVAQLLPRRLQEVPGIMHGGVGWQGIVPNRAAKMGSIAVDKGIAKLGTASDFYQQLEPKAIAEHVVAVAQNDIRDVVERIMEREHAQLWHDLPPRVREAVHRRVLEQLPEIVDEIVTGEIADHIDQVLDPKLMVIRHMEANPELANKVFEDVGKRELRLMINFGFIFGFLLGIPVIFIAEAFPVWWVLPVCGVIVGWITNLWGMQLIFEPVEPKQVGPVKMHGLFLRRKDAIADVYAGIIANDIVTLGNIGDHLLYGPRSDRTRQMLETALRPAVDRATGVARPAVRVAMGTREYDTIRDSVAAEAVEYTMTPFGDPEFNARQGAKIKELFASRMRELPYPDFVGLLRPAIKEDEWMIYAHGAILGFGAGVLHLLIFGV